MVTLAKLLSSESSSPELDFYAVAGWLPGEQWAITHVSPA